MKKEMLSENANIVASSRYFMDGENWEACIDRCATTVSSIENGNKEKIKEQFFNMIYNMEFLPGGRILRNSGRPRGSLFNCFHLPVDDSIESIGQVMKDSLILWSEGGGIGINFSTLRPKGDKILGKGGESSGLVSFIEAIDSISHTIESGGSRRAAAIAHVDVTHPEILNFIDAKLTHKKLEHFNISVSITEEFLDAVEQNKDWEFKFKQKVYGKISAIEIWNKIIENMIQCAEPGLMNWDNFIKNNSYYFCPILGCNPCITGDTLIAVADGRGDISIKQLENEGKDVPVFCLNEKTRKTEIKMMRHPRVTGYNKKILKVTLNDGSFVRCTENHKFTMFDGTFKEAQNLKPNDQLFHITKNCKENDYHTISNGGPEHRLIAEFYLGRNLKENEVVHHKNKIRNDNRNINLEVMIKNDHNRLHMIGNDNPMRDKWWNNATEEEKQIYKENMSKSTCGVKNGNYKGYTLDELIKIAINFIEGGIRNNKPSFLNEWKKYCDINNIPYWSSEIYKVGGYTSPDKFYSDILKGFNLDLSPIGVRNYKKYLELKDNTDLDIFFEDNIIKVRKNCEHCNKEFIIEWICRERTFCSRQCCNSSIDHRDSIRESYKRKHEIIRDQVSQIFLDLQKELNRDPKRFEIEKVCKERDIKLNLYGKYDKPNEFCFNYFNEIKEYSQMLDPGNYKVVKVEEDGYENVYNGTVDDHHNFYIKTNTIHMKAHYVNTANCGETTLGAHECCDLGSLVLPNFITGNVNTNWKKLQNTIELAVRFLDNVIDVNKYALKDNDKAAHDSRRIGLGVMGLAEYLFAKKLRYGSPKAIQEIENLMRRIRDYSYEASIKLAREKGSFPKFNPILYSKSSFIKKLPAQLRMDIKKYGIRNTTLLAIAPTGTISLLADMTSGIEPLFAKAYRRTDRVGERIYVHPLYENLLLNEGGEDINEWFVDTLNDLKPQDHFEVQAAVQKYVDGSVSKTINLPKDTTKEDLSNYLLEYMRDLKGVTVYRDGSREGQILNKITKDEVLKYLKETGKVSKTLDLLDVKYTSCASGKCSL